MNGIPIEINKQTTTTTMQRLYNTISNWIQFKLDSMQKNLARATVASHSPAPLIQNKLLFRQMVGRGWADKAHSPASASNCSAKCYRTELPQQTF